MKLTKSKLKEIIREELNEAVGKAELIKMVKMAQKAGAKKYDIVKSLASDLSKSEDEIVSSLEKYNLIGMVEGKIVKEGALYNRASGLVKTKDLYAFVKAGKDMKFELDREDFGNRQIQEFFNELIKKRIF